MRLGVLSLPPTTSLHKWEGLAPPFKRQRIDGNTITRADAVSCYGLPTVSTCLDTSSNVPASKLSQ